MCESCCSSSHHDGVTRRDFLKTGASAAVVASTTMSGVLSAEDIKDVSEEFKPLPKSPANVTVAFMYPPREVVDAGKFEDWGAKDG